MSARVRRVVSLLAVIVVAASMLTSSLSLTTAAPAPGRYKVRLPLIQNHWITPPPATSDQLIDAALARGEITAETALTYKVFASFGDPRLPARFKGDDRLIPDSHIVDKVLKQYATLSAATKAILNPFLIPPIYKGSWDDPAAADISPASPWVQDTPPACGAANLDQWDHVNGMHSNVRFWWKKSRPQDAAVANAYLMAMDNDIWPKLTALMGRVPRSDAAVSCNGGSGDLDVYLDPNEPRSYQASHNGTGCGAHPTYIVMNPAKSRLILAHEFMHSIQKAYAVSGGWCNDEFAWLSEATAMWAEDYVYPTVDEEHGQAPWFFDPAGTVQPLELTDDHHEYGAYLFFFFATHYLGDNPLVRRAWESGESSDSVTAVNKAIPGGFAAVWDKFAVYNWNRPPYDQYQKWDQLAVQPKLYGSNTTWLINAPVLLDFGYLATNSPHLSLTYQHFKFEGTEPRLITFYNGLTYELKDKPAEPMPYMEPFDDGTRQYDFVTLPPDDIKGVKIQALFKIEGQSDWTLEDWTGKPYVSFCRDAKAERLQELVIIYSNSEFSPRTYRVDAKNLVPKLQASDIGCWRYGGSASTELTGVGPFGHFEDRQQVSSVAFERMDVHPNIPYPAIRFRVATGQWQRTYDVANPSIGCSGHATASTTLGPSTGTGGLAVLAGASSGPSVRAYSGNGNSGQPFSVTITCPKFSAPFPLEPLPWFAVDLLTLMNEVPYTAKGGGVLDGSGDLVHAGGALNHFTWNLVPLREP